MGHTISKRELLTDIIRKRNREYTAFSPFLAYYWNFVSEERQTAGMESFIEGFGGDPLMRGWVKPVRVEHDRCRLEDAREGDIMITRYITPKGELVQRNRFSIHQKLVHMRASNQDQGRYISLSRLCGGYDPSAGLRCRESQACRDRRSGIAAAGVLSLW